MQQAQLFDLPLSLTVDLLQSWLSLKDLASLDTAECSRSTRPAYCEVLKAEGFVLDEVPQAKLVPLIRWIVDRKIKVRCIDLCNTDHEPGLIASFFGCSGRALDDLSVDNRSDSIVLVCCLAMIACDNLRVLQLLDCDNGDIASTMRRLIAAKAPTLERLALADSEVTEALPEACSMEKLEYLSFKWFTASTPRLCAFVRNCRYLLYFYCNDLDGSDDVLYALAESCPSLVSLHYGYEEVSTATGTAGLEAVLLACKDLHTVDFISYDGFTNAHVATVVQHCRKLKGLRLMLNALEPGIDEGCVTILTPRLPQLRLLHLVNLTCTSDAPIALLAQHCRSLQDLGLRYLHGAFTDIALVSLFGALTSLEDLDLSQVSRVSDVVLTAIARNCTNLNTLDLYGASGFTHKGISEIARGCADLDILAFKPDHAVNGSPLFSDLAQSLCRVFRPRLDYMTIDESWTRWNDFRRDV